MTRAHLKDDGTVVEILRDGSERPLTRQVDWAGVDATTEAEIAGQIALDNAEAMRDAAAYARRVRRKGRRAPQGPARALLRIIDRAPETALRALDQPDCRSRSRPG